jgi:hypothetical protein
MDYSFLKEDLVAHAICDCCLKQEADTVFVEMKGIGIVISQVCYMCAVLIDVQDIEFAFIPKKNARIKYEKYSPMRHPRKQG